MSKLVESISVSLQSSAWDEEMWDFHFPQRRNKIKKKEKWESKQMTVEILYEACVPCNVINMVYLIMCRLLYITI